MFQGEILDHLKRTQLENERQKFLQRTVYKYALQDTGYNHQGKSPCDPETRVEILATIKGWVNDLSEGNQNFFWLTGDPGSGKSAITASFARECKDAGILWAQFFINRNSESTTNPRFYFPSIACQMAEHTADPTLTVVMHEILRKRESLLDEICLDQGLEFFVKVVQAACDLDKSKPVTIIIDGLDETNRHHLEVTATVISKLFTKLERCNAKIFISSRTDDDITRPFYHSLQTDSKHVKHLHLDTSESRKDVEMYLRRNLECLVEKWVLDWNQWPGEDRFQTLCNQAGGLFIWAVTVVKFFRGQLEKHGLERRNRILNIFNDSGMQDVNNLYGMILKMTLEAHEDEWEYERFRWIVGFIIGLKEPLTIGDLSGLLDLRETLDSDPVDLIRFVTNLRTVVVAGTERVSNDTIPRLHKSFVEYITSKRTDPQFRIDVSAVHGQIATKCLRLVGRMKDAGERGVFPAGSVQYAVRNWTRHLPDGGISESGVGVIGSAEGLLKILSSTAGLRTGLMSASGDYRTHMYDPSIGLPLPSTLVTPPQYNHKSNIVASKSISTVTLSPDSQFVASGGHHGDVRIIDIRTHRTLWRKNNHNIPVSSLCFSPDSCRLVAGSNAGSIRMWDWRTKQDISSQLLGHTKNVRSICTDGQIIVSGSDDCTIRIWSYDTCQLVGEPINAGTSVCAVALSNKGRIAAAVDADVCVFDVETRQQIASMKGHTMCVLTVAFSPDGSRIVSGSVDKTIRIWDVQTGSQTHMVDDTNDVWSVAFSSDSHWIASRSGNTTLRVWNSQTGETVGLPLKVWDLLTGGVSFSPDTRYLVSAISERDICIWSAPFEWQKPSQQTTFIHLSQYQASSRNDRISLEGHPSVISACCSPDGKYYAASTLEGHVSIWDTDHKLLWETNASVHPIHLLKFSETHLVLSTIDGSSISWKLLDENSTDEEAITRGPQLDSSHLHQSTSLSNDTVSWFPFDFDAGLWAYVDSCLIRFESKEGSVTFLDLSGSDLAG